MNRRFNFAEPCPPSGMRGQVGEDDRCLCLADGQRALGGSGVSAPTIKAIAAMAALDALINEDKTLICLTGPAGTSKTLLGIASALHSARTRAPEPAQEQADPEADVTSDEQHLTRKQRKMMENRRGWRR